MLKLQPTSVATLPQLAQIAARPGWFGSCGRIQLRIWAALIQSPTGCHGPCHQKIMSEWIGVKERLPVKDEEVIILALLYETIASYNGETWIIDPYDSKKGVGAKNITH